MRKLLIANRGEIALRVMRSAKEMGIKTVAVYSDADTHAPFVRMADESYRLGPAPSSESYLRIDKIIQACKELDVDAIHPGYGFLSENAEFARRLHDEGITLVGPSPKAMELMGDKLAAKETVRKYDIPLVPGTEGAVSDLNEAMDVAKDIGFPVLVKAAAGGGGKGMRIVEAESELEEGLKRAISEAESAFGDGSVFIEKYVGRPRHIEVQVLADTHGNVVYLFERECSIQRRHQKVVEEAPSAVLSEELRKRMGEAAVNVARSCDYVGAGTVEFLLDESGEFYFMEMNTRLQVEHPVTEMISGIDLVKEQIKVARGEKLDFTQEDLKISGHSIELRVYAEDPTTGFLPDIGRLNVYRKPEGEGIRVDDAFEQGMDIPIHYDPMIAKLVVHAEDRPQAIELMKKAIENYMIGGITTTLQFGHYVMGHDAFVSGDYDTHFVRDHFQPSDLTVSDSTDLDAAYLAAAYDAHYQDDRFVPRVSEESNSGPSNWKLRRS